MRKRYASGLSVTLNWKKVMKSSFSSMQFKTLSNKVPFGECLMYSREIISDSPSITKECIYNSCISDALDKLHCLSRMNNNHITDDGLASEKNSSSSKEAETRESQWDRWPTVRAPHVWCSPHSLAKAGIQCLNSLVSHLTSESIIFSTA